MNRWQTAQLWGKTLGVFVSQPENDGIIIQIIAIDDVLRNHTVLILNLNGHAVIGQQRFSFLKDAGHLAGLDAVIVVLAHPDLQLAGLTFAQCATAIDEGLADGTNLGDVKRHRHRRSVRQGQSEITLRML